MNQVNFRGDDQALETDQDVDGHHTDRQMVAADKNAETPLPIGVEEKERIQDVDLLIRKIDQQIQLKGQSTSAAQSVPFTKILSVATRCEMFMLVFGHFCAVLMGLVIPAFSFLLGDAFNSFGPELSKEQQLASIKNVMITIVCMAAGMWVAAYFFWICLCTFSLRVSRRIKDMYLASILRQDCTWFDMINYTELSSRISKESLAIQRGIGEKSGMITMSCAMTVSGLIVGFIRGWHLALCLLGMCIPLGIVTAFFTINLTQGFQKSLAAYSQSAGYAEQAMTAIRVVIAFGMERTEITNYSKYLHRSQETSIRNHKINAISLGFLMLLIYWSYTFAFYIGSVFCQRHVFNPAFNRNYQGGDVIACFFGVITALFSASSSSQHYKAVIEAKAAAKFAFDVIDRVPQVLEDDPNAEKHELKGEIEFKNVVFYYPSRPDSKVLKNLNAKFELGKTTAIVGPSGAGKSSIAQLIESFYLPNEGEILVDGKPLKSLNLLNYRQQIGYVSQEPVLFNTTIKKNILMGKSTASDEELIEALKRSNAWEFVQKQPEGINTHVGQSGNQLSGGQKQRLALARAFIKKPKIFIFDEATSALDKNNEQEVQKAIDEMKGSLSGVTSIVIAHRLSTIRNADKIIVMNLGEVIEEGSHDYLMANYPNGTYSKLVADQMSAEAKNEPTSAQSVKEGELEVDQKVDDIEAEQTKKANEELELQDKQIKEKMDGVLDKKKQQKTFKTKISKYNKPLVNIVVGLIFNVLNGFMGPLYGIFIIKAMFGMILYIEDSKMLRQEVDFWCMIMFILSFVSMCATFLAKSAFGRVGENITQNIRIDLYTEILRKHVGWHDDQNNAAGVLSAILASDVQVLNGLGSEAAAVTSEAACSLVGGIVISLIFSWKVALVALAFVPFSLIGAAINAKVEWKENENSQDQSEGKAKNFKSADLLATDAIQNYRTVASFGLQKVISSEYSQLGKDGFAREQRAGHIAGFVYGYSKFVENIIFGVIFYFGTLIMINDPNVTPDKFIVSVFAIIFGAFGAGQAASFGPDAGKAVKAADKIFKVIDYPTQINAIDVKNAENQIQEPFKGEIEFKNVWFRYPLRPKQWVFKGLNLKINPQDQIAIVGESGQGKSTFILLLMRFYDVNFGEILVDGVDIRKLDVTHLRRKMGLVMQEPTLFNYTVKENVLYGNQTASNDEIVNACQVANCRIFIESDDLQYAVEDDVKSLNAAMSSEVYKMKLIEKIGQQAFDEKQKILAQLEKKEEKAGAFKPIKDELDVRTPEQKGQTNLHNGYLTYCGNRGSKLSGGQKQRIAIARAVVRQPAILLLDEATSALDEESQRKVQAALETVMKNRTSIVIAHRMTTVEKCNRVAVIENGVIVEEGGFNELKNKQNGIFSQLASGMKKKQ